MKLATINRAILNWTVTLKDTIRTDIDGNPLQTTRAFDSLAECEQWAEQQGAKRVKIVLPRPLQS